MKSGCKRYPDMVDKCHCQRCLTWREASWDDIRHWLLECIGAAAVLLLFVAGTIAIARLLVGCGPEPIHVPKTTSTTIIPPVTREPL